MLNYFYTTEVTLACRVDYYCVTVSNVQNKQNFTFRFLYLINRNTNTSDYVNIAMSHGTGKSAVI